MNLKSFAEQEEMQGFPVVEGLITVMYDIHSRRDGTHDGEQTKCQRKTGTIELRIAAREKRRNELNLE